MFEFFLILLLTKLRIDRTSDLQRRRLMESPSELNQQSWRLGVKLVCGDMILEADQAAAAAAAAAAATAAAICLDSKKGFSRSIHLFLGQGRVFAKTCFLQQLQKSVRWIIWVQVFTIEVHSRSCRPSSHLLIRLNTNEGFRPIKGPIFLQILIIF